MLIRLKFLVLLVVLFLSGAGIAYAQNSPPPPRNAPPPPPGLALPIDDHLWVLVLVGIALGIYFMVKKKTTGVAA